MKYLSSGIRSLVLPLSLLAASCVDDSGGGNAPIGSKAAYGSFQVSLVKPTAITPGFTSVLGAMFPSPTPASVIWVAGAKSGSCQIFTPRIPFCEQSCGSDSICVETNKCQLSPTAVGVGTVSVSGLKTSAGATAFSMDPVNKAYQPTGALRVAFPPFAEGDEVKFSASGDTAYAAFSLTTHGIAPLEAVADTFALADGKPIEVAWTAAKTPANSDVFVLVDLSHHGGSKGKIECEGPDNGKLEIPAVLVDQLKALGVSGFPKIEISRKAVAANADGKVQLVLESQITSTLSIPGLVSCTEDAECPAAQTCQPDLKCK